MGCSENQEQTNLTIGAIEIPVLNERESALQDSLRKLEAVHDSMLLWTALKMARRLEVRRSPHPTTYAARALQTELYQRLCLLHYDRGLRSDSVAHYAKLAAASMPGTQDPVLTARQLLCESYTLFYDRSWTDITLLASLGRELLARSGHTQLVSLRARLLLIESIAARYRVESVVGDLGRPPQQYEKALALARAAVKDLSEADLPLRSEASAQLAFVHARLPISSAEYLALLRSKPFSFDPRTAELGYGHRTHLLAYYYQRKEQWDSAAIYWEQLLEAPPFFNARYLSEARYNLHEIMLRRGDYHSALGINMLNTLSYGCCPTTDIITVHGRSVADCMLRPACGYYLAGRASDYLALYDQSGGIDHLDEAVALSQTALASYERSFPTLREESALNRIMDIGTSLLDVGLTVAVRAAERYTTLNCMERVFQAMERGKVFLLLRHPSAAAATQGTYNELVAQQHTLQQQLLREPSSLFDKIRYWENYNTLENMEQTWRSTPELPVSKPTSLVALRTHLNQQQGFLEFAETEGQLYALYVDHSATEVYTVDTTVLSEAIQFTRHLSRHGKLSARTYDSLANRLTQQLIGPVLPHLLNLSELLIVPSSRLTHLPFGALVTSPGSSPKQFADLSYLVQQVAIRYAYSWSAYQQITNSSQSTYSNDSPTVAIWTNPSLQAYLGPLADSLLLQGSANSVQFENEDCGRASYLNHSRQADILQLSVHARANPGQLHGNFLYFSTTDSLNEVYISSTNLRAHLVVLAACSTRRGFTARGEGTFSLSRSFHAAGVPEVVSSVYDLPADATAGVLHHFYREYFAGRTVPSALTAAQRAMIAGRGKQRWVHPSYWAGLVVS